MPLGQCIYFPNSVFHFHWAPCHIGKQVQSNSLGYHWATGVPQLFWCLWQTYISGKQQTHTAQTESNTFNLLEVVSNERWNLWGWTGGDISRWQMSYKEVRRDTTLQGSLINKAQWTIVNTFNLFQLVWQIFRILEKHTNNQWNGHFLMSQHII